MCNEELMFHQIQQLHLHPESEGVIKSGFRVEIFIRLFYPLVKNFAYKQL